MVQREASSRFVMLGAYLTAYLGDQAALDAHAHGLDAWASPGASMSILGLFLAIEYPSITDINLALYDQFEAAWSNGYTVFLNLETIWWNAAQIAQGDADYYLTLWADAYRNWAAQGGGRFAYIAPLQEMNSCASGGCWTTYGGDPAGFKAAYARIRQIFASRGVTDEMVEWVFAPNGWSSTRYDYPFESYYPGDDSVDVVGFSAYNFGYYPPYTDWAWPQEVYNPPTAPPEGQYLDRMRLMAPNKPIFIAQTATSSYYAGGIPSVNKKNQWLREGYTYLAHYPGVRAIIYLNQGNGAGSPDWAFFIPDDPAHQYEGYREAVTDPLFRYISPEVLSSIELTP